MSAQRITIRRGAFQFFFQHAGYVVGERAKGALALARAEAEAEARGFCFVWEPDAEPDLSWLVEPTFSRAYVNADHAVECCIVYASSKRRQVLRSLGNVVDADAAYRRVVEAELAADALAEIHEDEDAHTLHVLQAFGLVLPARLGGLSATGRAVRAWLGVLDDAAYGEGE